LNCFPQDIAQIAQLKGFDVVLVTSKYSIPGWIALEQWKTASYLRFPIFEVESWLFEHRDLIVNLSATENPYLSPYLRLFFSIIVCSLSLLRGYFSMKCLFQAKYQPKAQRWIIGIALVNLFYTFVVMTEQSVLNYENLSNHFFMGEDSFIFFDLFCYTSYFLSNILFFCISNRNIVNINDNQKTRNFIEKLMIFLFFCTRFIAFILAIIYFSRSRTDFQTICFNVSLCIDILLNIILILQKFEVNKKKSSQMWNNLTEFQKSSIRKLTTQFYYAAIISIVCDILYAIPLFDQLENHNPYWILSELYIVHFLNIGAGLIQLYSLDNLLNISDLKTKPVHDYIPLMQANKSLTSKNSNPIDFKNVWKED
jgi:hypothetical protein